MQYSVYASQFAEIKNSHKEAVKRLRERLASKDASVVFHRPISTPIVENLEPSGEDNEGSTSTLTMLGRKLMARFSTETIPNANSITPFKEKNPSYSLQNLFLPLHSPQLPSHEREGGGGLNIIGASSMPSTVSTSAALPQTAPVNIPKSSNSSYGFSASPEVYNDFVITDDINTTQDSRNPPKFSNFGNPFGLPIKRCQTSPDLVTQNLLKPTPSTSTSSSTEYSSISSTSQQQHQHQQPTSMLARSFQKNKLNMPYYTQAEDGLLSHNLANANRNAKNHQQHFSAGIRDIERYLDNDGVHPKQVLFRVQDWKVEKARFVESLGKLEPEDGTVIFGAWVDDSNAPVSGGDSISALNKRIGYNVGAIQVWQKLPPVPAMSGPPDYSLANHHPNGTINLNLLDEGTDAAIFLTVYPTGLTNITDVHLNDLATQSPEMNGNWFVYGSSPKEFLSLWIRFYNIMKNTAPQVATVWSPNFNGPPDQEPYAPYWPGPEFVDWVGVSVYWKGSVVDYPWTQNELAPANYAAQIIDAQPGIEGGPDSFYRDYAVAYNKPFVVSESAGTFHVGVYDPTNNTSTSLPLGVGRKATIMIEDQNTENDYRATVDPNTLSVFKAGLDILNANGILKWATPISTRDSSDTYLNNSSNVSLNSGLQKFNAPRSAILTINKSITSKLKSSYSIGIPDARSVGFLYSSADLNIPSDPINVFDREIVAPALIPVAFLSDESENKETGERIDDSSKYHSIIYGRLFEDYRLEALVSQKVGRNHMVIVSGISSWDDVTNSHLEAQYIHRKKDWCADVTYSSTDNVIGTSCLVRVPYNNWSAGAEVIYTASENSGGISFGAKWVKVHERGISSILTFLSNPMMGHWNTTYTATIRPNFVMATSYDFNTYSYNSDIAVGVAYSPTESNSRLLKCRFSMTQGIALLLEGQFRRALVGLGVTTNLGLGTSTHQGIGFEVQFE
ncbi:hypothetical protein HK100_004298 [Physocladia obscura]|uniref:GH26 domain-containing protein n=1 Tax=Physocladia obscura TaxID=109957 RepID=A0AAD5T6G9_9FUNG|nr:hypothetical protein HK100_004298 [Physocladia obscura]